MHNGFRKIIPDANDHKWRKRIANAIKAAGGLLGTGLLFFRNRSSIKVLLKNIATHFHRH